MKATDTESKHLYVTPKENSLDADWYDPNEAGGVNVNFIDETDNSKSNFWTNNPWLDDFNDNYQDDIYVVRRGRRKQFFIIGALAILAVCGAIIVSVVLGRSADENKQMNGDIKMTSGFQPITESLVSACSLKSIRSVSGLKLCESMCSVADCCAIPDGEEFSCYSDRKADCDDYRRVCSASDLTSEQKNNDNDLIIAENIINTCKKEKISSDVGKEACRDLCEPHACCFADEQKNCHQNDSEKCHVYAGCFSLYDNTEQSIFSKVNSACGEESLVTLEGFNKCHSICAAHLCCFSSDPNENCADEHHLECASYSPCASLTKSTMLIDEDTPVEKYDDTSEKINQVCSKDNINHPSGLEECHNICSKALCCFTNTEIKSNCIDTLGQDVCSLYGPCEILANGDEDPKTIVNSPKLGEVKEVCHPNILHIDHGKRCKSACDKGSCCFTSGSGGCYETDKAWCETFTECKNVYPDWQDLGGSKKEVDKFGKGSSTQTEIRDICSLENFSRKFGQDVGRSICHRICDPHRCCFDNSSSSCDKSDSICTEFHGCKDLYIYEDLKGAVKTACAEDMVFEKCESLCDGQLCCFDDVASSELCHLEVCDIYQSCWVLTNKPVP